MDGYSNRGGLANLNVFETDELLPEDEFVEEYENRMFKKVRRNIRSDGIHYISGFLSLYQHLTYAEFIVITLMSLGMTLFFCYYYYPGPEEEYRLAARLRFNIIATAVLFPSTMLINESANRRENALRRFAATRALILQLMRGYLFWRQPKVAMSEEWEKEAYQVLVRLTNLICSLLTLPTMRSRHRATQRGKQFREETLHKRDALNAELVKVSFQLHTLVEDLKEVGLPPQESIRFFYHIFGLFREIDGMWAVKVYRTSSSARSFVRIILTACIMFYGPYYSFVAGALVAYDGSHVNIPFACVLSLASSTLLLTIVTIHRALEDPFLWRYPGDVVDVDFEREEILVKLERIYQTKLSKAQSRRDEPSPS